MAVRNSELWQLQAKAGIRGPLRGGVLADALGAGKTVTVIALEAADVQAARKLPRAAAEGVRWTPANHRLCSADVRKGARARALLLSGRSDRPDAAKLDVGLSSDVHGQARGWRRCRRACAWAC